MNKLASSRAGQARRGYARAETLTVRNILTLSFVMMLALAFGCLKARAELSPETIAGAQTISTDEAKALFVKGAKFIDVRTDVAFDAGRIPGSVLLEIKRDFTKEALARLVALDEPFVVYCSGQTCLRAGKAAKKAVSWGYTNVKYYRDGLPDWEKASHPVE